MFSHFIFAAFPVYFFFLLVKIIINIITTSNHGRVLSDMTTRSLWS